MRSKAGRNISSQWPTNSNSTSSVSVEDGDGKYALVGMVSHIGKNTGSGHYVAHLKKEVFVEIFNEIATDRFPMVHVEVGVIDKLNEMSKASLDA